MTTRRSRGDRRPRQGAGSDPAHAPGKQHLDLEADEVRQSHLPDHVRPDTESPIPDSESRIGRGRMPRRG